ncbi:MAG: DUF2723 domain-containing protein [Bacteroidetes bacterium]|nr:DUF2723 domain-containing protein [Bacteroidota bacterium]
MKNYQKINNILGWSVFLIATIVYLLTLEPTASWWDCGEYISTSFKLQVGHPPGAPTFQLIGRLFSLLAFGDLSRVAVMVNTMSALSSSFTILFLFWSITMLAKKVVLRNGEMTDGKMWAVMGSGLVGALAYTFSDSFWFSAEEGEVYAMSSFFTALVFWAILKWEVVSEEKGSYRWIILIAFLMGLSIGVHLLNLLTLPALCFVFYYKKYKTSKKGIILTTLLSFIILSIIMYFLIPQLVNFSALFELFFVNSLGFPFNSGTIVYFLVLTGLIGFGLYYAKKKQKTLLHSLIMAFTFILLGYSSFFMLIIRSNADTPIDENDPEDAIGLLSYLNREQYGTWPLFSGQYYMAPVTSYEDGSPVYQRDKASGKYVIVDDRKQTVPVYDSRFTTIFPRMWSNQKSSHVSAYKDWGGEGGIPIQTTKNDGTSETLYKPTFGQNLRFFFTYQIGHMYFRYFMWNFVGRQNDVEGYGGIENGNWISGIPFIDNARLGDQDNLPFSMKNPARNKFYFLPLILGLIGLWYHVKKHPKDSWIITLFFLMTGLAIVTWLNQTPYQPRERDYSYAGSFYAFAFWIGLGVLALFDYLSSKLKNLDPRILAGVITVVCLLLVPGIMGQQGWDDHNRAHKYTCKDFACNYLESCAPNAILITNGDNDTFPLWYAQEVEGVRTDVRVVNFMLASGDWYIHQLSRKMYKSDPLPLTIPPNKYDKGLNEYIPFYDKEIPDFVDVKQIIDFINSDDEQTKLALQNGKKISYIPTKSFRLKVDSANCIKSGIVPKELANRMVPSIEWKMKKNYLFKNELMLLDFLATSNWTRPLYFANPSTVEDFMEIDQYCHLEGMVYKFMPVVASERVQGLGGITTSQPSFDILMNKCKWGNLNDPRVTVDRESYRNVMIPKNNFARLAQKLVGENKKAEAIKVLDRCQEAFPNEKVHYDYYMLPFVEVYYKAGAMDKANKLLGTVSDIIQEDIKYYNSLKPKFAKYFDKEKNTDLAVLRRLSQLATENKQEAAAKKIDTFLATFSPETKPNNN